VQLRVDGDHIEYAAPGGESWRIAIADVRMIGEFLSRQNRGPEHHFLVFMTREEWFKAPYDAEGRDAFLAEFGRRLDFELRPDLLRATTFSSRVLWPGYLEGRPIFDLIPEARAENIVTRIRQFFLQKVAMHFTDEVREELGRE